MQNNITSLMTEERINKFIKHSVSIVSSTIVASTKEEDFKDIAINEIPYNNFNIRRILTPNQAQIFMNIYYVNNKSLLSENELEYYNLIISKSKYIEQIKRYLYLSEIKSYKDYLALYSDSDDISSLFESAKIFDNLTKYKSVLLSNGKNDIKFILSKHFVNDRLTYKNYSYADLLSVLTQFKKFDNLQLGKSYGIRDFNCNITLLFVVEKIEGNLITLRIKTLVDRAYSFINDVETCFVI